MIFYIKETQKLYHPWKIYLVLFCLIKDIWKGERSIGVIRHQKWLSNAIPRHRSILAQALACCIAAKSYNLNQCCCSRYWGFSLESILTATISLGLEIKLRKLLLHLRRSIALNHHLSHTREDLPCTWVYSKQRDDLLLPFKEIHHIPINHS